MTLNDACLIQLNRETMVSAASHFYYFRTKAKHICSATSTLDDSRAIYPLVVQYPVIVTG